MEWACRSQGEKPPAAAESLYTGSASVWRAPGLFYWAVFLGGGGKAGVFVASGGQEGYPLRGQAPASSFQRRTPFPKALTRVPLPYYRHTEKNRGKSMFFRCTLWTEKKSVLLNAVET